MKNIECKDQYFRNNCEPDKRVPALKEYCLDKEICMNRNPENTVLVLPIAG